MPASGPHLRSVRDLFGVYLLPHSIVSILRLSCVHVVSPALFLFGIVFGIVFGIDGRYIGVRFCLSLLHPALILLILH